MASNKVRCSVVRTGLGYADPADPLIPGFPSPNPSGAQIAYLTHREDVPRVRLFLTGRINAISALPWVSASFGSGTPVGGQAQWPFGLTWVEIVPNRKQPVFPLPRPEISRVLFRRLLRTDGPDSAPSSFQENGVLRLKTPSHETGRPPGPRGARVAAFRGNQQQERSSTASPHSPMTS